MGSSMRSISSHSDTSYTGSSSQDDSSSTEMGSLSYGVGLSIGVLVLLTTITLAAYFCTRDSSHSNHRRTANSVQDDCILDVEGIDEATLKTYPKFKYSSITKNKEKMDTTETCCSVCLADYKGDDMVRALPECGHVFHVKCVDPWLRLHPTCPVCRTSPLPTPLSTPLAQVAPIAVSRSTNV